MKKNHNFQFLFLIGSAKTGTTLLARTCDQNPQVACIHESYLMKKGGRSSLLNFSNNRYKQYGYKKLDIIYWYCLDKFLCLLVMIQKTIKISNRLLRSKNFFEAYRFLQLGHALFTDFGQRCNCKIIGDKWPWYIDYIEILLEAFPHAKFIYNVRDPRAVYHSGNNFFKGREIGLSNVQEMIEKDKKIEPYLEKTNFLTIRYEDVITNPQETIKKIYDFLEVDFKEDYLIYNRDHDPFPDRWNLIPETREQFNPFHTFKWREQMSEEDIKWVTQEAEDFIQKYQYEI